MTNDLDEVPFAIKIERGPTDESKYLAAGAVFSILRDAGCLPIVEEVAGRVTNSMIISLGFLERRYRVTVDRVPERGDS